MISVYQISNSRKTQVRTISIANLRLGERRTWKGKCPGRHVLYHCNDQHIEGLRVTAGEFWGFWAVLIQV